MMKEVEFWDYEFLKSSLNLRLIADVWACKILHKTQISKSLFLRESQKLINVFIPHQKICEIKNTKQQM